MLVASAVGTLGSSTAGGLVGGAATAASIRAANRPITTLTNEAGETVIKQESRGVANTIGANSADFGSAAARGAIAGASGNVANDFVNGKRSMLGAPSRAAPPVPSAARWAGRPPGTRDAPPDVGSGWNSNGAQHLGNTAGNNGNDEPDDHPKLQYRP